MRFLQSTVEIFSSQLVAQFAYLIAGIMISRRFGDDGKGLVSLMIYVPTALYLFSQLGLGAAAPYFIARNDGARNVHLTHMLLFPVSLGLVIIAVFVLSYSVWQPLLDGLPLTTFLPSLLLVPLLLVFDPGCNFLNAQNQFRARNASVLLQSYSLLGGVVVIMFIFTSVPVDQVIWCYVAAYTVGAAACLSFNFHSAGLPARPSLPLLRRTIKYGFWMYLSNLARMAYGLISFLLLVSARDIGQGGVYSVAVGLTAPLLTIPHAIQMVLFPRTSALTDEEAKQSTPTYFRQTLIVMLLVAVGTAILSRPVLMLYGKDFLSGQVPVFILLLSIILEGANGILMTHLLGRGKAYASTVVSGGVLVITVLLSYSLIPSLGMNGAALAILCAQLAVMIALLWLFRRVSHGELKTLFAFQVNDLSGLIRLIKFFLSLLSFRRTKSEL